ncbi:MAG: hypothetical protein AB7C97_03395 [Oscillospiraceae bacterium]
MLKVWYISAALLGMVMHSFGLVMQKKGMDHLDFKRLKDFKVSHDFIIWFIGILLAYVISVLPTGIASKGLSPQVVSSISGLSIVLVVILSHFFLKERVFLLDVILSVVIILSISGISIIKDDTPYTSMNIKALYAMIFAPFLLLLPLLNKKAGNKLKTFEFAAFSGLTSGLCFVLLNIAVKESGGSFSGLFSTVYPYEYTAVGFFSTISMQAAYRYGKIINIAPLQISLGVIYPLICSYFIFQKSISAAQDLLIVVIAICCAVIQKKH